MDNNFADRPAALIKGIAFGDKSALSGREKAVLSHTGVMHAFAVSGLHIGFVVLFVNVILNLIGQKFMLPRFVRPVLIVLAVCFYASVVGWSASVNQGGCYVFGG